LAARQSNVNRVIEQAERLSRDDGSAGPRPAGSSFPDAALEYPQIHIAAIANAGKANVGTLRKALMPFDQWPKLIDAGGINVVNEQDAMRVAHR
jgi:hypothetical protein